MELPRFPRRRSPQNRKIGDTTPAVKIKTKPAMTTVDNVVDILSKIGVYLQRISVHIIEKIEIAKKYFRNGDGLLNHQKLMKIFSLLTTLYGHLPKFTSGDPAKVLQGMADIVSCVSSFTGLGAPLVPIVCGVLAVIFSSFGGNDLTVGQVVESEIRRTFSGHSYETLLEEAEELHLMYQLTYDFLGPKSEKREFSEHDITNMNIQMNIFQGATFLRKLGKLIKELAKEHEENDRIKKSEKAEAAMQFIELYSKLASLRDMILWYFFTTINSTNHSQHLAGCVKRVIDSFDERDREALGMFLKPTKEYVYIVSYVSEEKHELFMKFLEQKKLLPDQIWLTQSDFKLCSIKWPRYHVVRPKNRSYLLFGGLRFLRGSDKMEGQESIFGFTQHRKHYFEITHWGKSGEVLSMTTSSHRWVKSVRENSLHKNEWKVIEMENRNYVFSPRDFPEYFMGMSKLFDGSIAGFLGGYNEQCQWKLERLRPKGKRTCNT